MVRILLLGVVVLCFSFASAAAGEKAGKYWVFVGTNTGGKSASKGVYRIELDLATGKLGEAGLAAEVKNPSFIAIHPTNRYLYAVSEVSESGGKPAGAVFAFSLDQAAGTLKPLNHQPSGGAGPCHVVVDKAGKNVLVANYGGGNAACIQVGDDGSLTKVSAVVNHEGSSVNKSRQEKPHAHSINLDPGNRFAFVADLGIDKVMIYRFDSAKGSLLPNKPEGASLKPGAGPRHFAFHPSGKYAYVINELDSTITSFAYNADQGELTALGSVATIPTGFKGSTTTAEVVVHPSGKFVYGSNRGHDSIAIFRVLASGDLAPAGYQNKDIKTPRNFAIEPTGQYLLVGNQGSSSIVVFRINQETGELTPVGPPVACPTPICLRFVPKPGN